MTTLPVWFALPPIVGGADTYTILKVTTQKDYNKFNGYGEPQFTTQAAAEAFVKARNGSFTLSTNPAKAIIQAATGNATAQGQSKSATQDLGGTFASLNTFFGNLTSLNLWLRVAKVLVGGTLLIVGIAKMAGFDKGIVGTAVKAAPLL